jgi:phage terminase large subunit-like protein
MAMRSANRDLFVMGITRRETTADALRFSRLESLLR